MRCKSCGKPTTLAGYCSKACNLARMTDVKFSELGLARLKQNKARAKGKANAMMTHACEYETYESILEDE